jgi:leucyl aminopeptidase
VSGPGYSVAAVTPTRPSVVLDAHPSDVRTAAEPLAGAWRSAEVVFLALARGPQRPEPGDLARAVAGELGLDLAAVLAAEKATGRAGEVTRLPVPPADGLPARVLLLGAGAGAPSDLRRAGAALARAARGRGRVVTDLGVVTDGDGDGAAERVRAAVEGLILGGWAPPASGLKDRSDARPAAEVLLDPALPATAVDRGRVHAGATLLARLLAATPADVKDPDWMARAAQAAAAGSGLDVEVWEEVRLAAEGFGGLLAVGGASSSPPRLVRLEHRPDGTQGERPVVLVGKGITFDTGGLAIKPREGMLPMRTDMSGAGAVLATLAACRAAGVRRRVVGLLPLAENAVGAASYRPGDVVRQYGGRTTEVVNTDAEGRVVLADAMAWADEHLDPEVVVDVATLTGAASLGLGRRHAALYSPDDDLAAALAAAAGAAGEQAWRMPLVEDYRPAIDSAVADVRQAVTAPGFGAGSITAALFLREFAGGRRWAHLDIAGPARSDKEEHEVPKGPTGYGARLLLRWLEQL